MVSPLLPTVFDLFARGGGGGSGGGGDGGGSIIVAMGYIPMHVIGAWFRKHGSSNLVASVVQQVIGWIIAVIYAIFWLIAWRGFGFVVAASAILGMGAGLYNWFRKHGSSNLVASVV